MRFVNHNHRFLEMGAAAGTAALAAALLRSEYERAHFVVEETKIASPKIRSAHTLVFLTDLHDREFGQRNRRLLDAVRQIRPDAVLIGGDMMLVKPRKAELAVTEDLLEDLAGLCPVYYANGNHEQRMWQEPEEYRGLYQKFRRILHKNRIRYLSDGSAFLWDDVRISGLNLDKKYYDNFFPPNLSARVVTAHLGKPEPERYQILLAHNPLFFDAYVGWGADLTLAGHFHGGTIRLPVLGGLMTPQYQFFSRYCAGTFEKGERRMLVGRGLGTHSVNIRLGNLPQVCMIRLEPGMSGQQK